MQQIYRRTPMPKYDFNKVAKHVLRTAKCLRTALSGCFWQYQIAIYESYSFSVFLLSFILTLSWQRPLSYRNQSIDLLCKSVDWFLYDNSLRQERVKQENKLDILVVEVYSHPAFTAENIVISPNFLLWKLQSFM